MDNPHELLDLHGRWKVIDNHGINELQPLGQTPTVCIYLIYIMFILYVNPQKKSKKVEKMNFATTFSRSVQQSILLGIAMGSHPNPNHLIIPVVEYRFAEHMVKIFYVLGLLSLLQVDKL